MVFIQGAIRVIAGRVCAIRKTEEAIKRTQKQPRRNASRDGEVLQPETLEYAKFIIVFTTFDPLTLVRRSSYSGTGFAGRWNLPLSDSNLSRSSVTCPRPTTRVPGRGSTENSSSRY